MDTKKCTVESCSKTAWSRGLCGAHYARRRLGKPLDTPLQVQHHGMTPLQRLLVRMKVKPTGCWEWQGSKDRNGYGRIHLESNIPVLTHRASWMLHCGPIPDGINVLHRCDNPPCCNPDHLFLGTQADNVADMAAKGRDRKRGHKGEAQANAKLTEELVRQMRASSHSDAYWSDKTGVSRATVHSARRRKTWAHVA